MKNKIFALQDHLKTHGCCSLPQLMLWLDMDYTTAAALLHKQLIPRGMVSGRVEGIHYPAQPENLRLRKLPRWETEQIFPEMTRYEIAALMRVSEECGVERAGVERAVRIRSRLEETITQLEEKNLIYCYDDKYFPCIPYAEAALLQTLMRCRMDLLEEEEEEEREKWLQRAKKYLDRYYGES